MAPTFQQWWVLLIEDAVHRKCCQRLFQHSQQFWEQAYKDGCEPRIADLLIWAQDTTEVSEVLAA